jgi:hypothetical protein
MAVSSTIRIVSFIGNGGASVFAFAFKVFQNSDVVVTEVNTATGVATPLALTTDYTVALNSDQNNSPGGTVTLTAGALASGYSLAIFSAVPMLQVTSLANAGGFYPTVINDALDRLTILVQQLQLQVNRCLRFPPPEVGINAQLAPAAQRAGTILYFGSDGSPSLLPAAPPGGFLFAGDLLGTIDGVNQVFTLTNAGSPLGRSPVQATVWCNYPLVAGVGYSLGPLAGQVTFTSAPQPAAGSGSADVLFAQGVF